MNRSTLANQAGTRKLQRLWCSSWKQERPTPMEVNETVVSMLPSTSFAMRDLRRCAQTPRCHLRQLCGFSSNFPFRCPRLHSREVWNAFNLWKWDEYKSRSILMANTLWMAKSALATWRSLFKAMNLAAITELFDMAHTEMLKKHLQPFLFLFSQEYTNIVPQHSVQEHHSLKWKCSVVSCAKYFVLIYRNAVLSMHQKSVWTPFYKKKIICELHMFWFCIGYLHCCTGQLCCKYWIFTLQAHQ